MLRAMKRVLIVPALMLAFQSQAATEDLDSLLTSIKADIQNQRLSSPAGNNALERISAFREQAPFDFRVVPLTYEWGEAYVALANKAIANGQMDKAQGYLDKVWYVASLTPGLEEAQAKIDAGSKSKGAKKASTKQVAKAKGPSKEELARQKKVAAAAAKEKARLEAERKRKLEQAKKEALAEKKRLEAEKKRKQEQERQRRLAAAKAEKEAAAQRAAAAKKAKQSGKKVVAKAAPAPVVKVAKKASAAEIKGAKSLWQSAKENTAPLASYPVSAEMIANRDRSIANDLEPVCKAILDNDASVVVHTPEKADYRWLTVRLTLCLRRLDRSFRLRHSHQLAQEDQPIVTLHPSRGVSLVRQVER